MGKPGLSDGTFDKFPFDSAWADKRKNGIFNSGRLHVQGEISQVPNDDYTSQ
jgi:hypothetical protein